MDQDFMYKEYFDSIFKHSNIYSKEEYEAHSQGYELNYGKHLPPDSTSAILDIGCGAGHFLYFLDKKGYKNALGIDLSQQQVDFCRKNISQKVETADAFAYLEGRTAIYDVITANDVLEHIPKDKVIPFLALIYNALKPDGVFLAKTPNLGNPFALALRYVDFTHNIGLTEKSFYQVLWLAGFRRIGILPREEKGIRNKLSARIIQFIISKLMWYQGCVAPKILSPIIICAARK